MCDSIDGLEKQIKEHEDLMQKITEPCLNIKSLFEPSAAMRALMEPSPAMKALSECTAPIKALHKNISPLLETQRELKTLIKPYGLETCMTKGMLIPFNGIFSKASEIQAKVFSNSAVKLLGGYTTTIQTAFRPPIMSWLKDSVTSPLVGILSRFESLIPKGFSVDCFNEIYLNAMYESRWFPYANSDIELTITILDVLNETRKGKKRVKCIDEAIYKYYTKTAIEDIRKSWRTLDLPKFKVRILNQAVRAYHRNEFALTVSAFVSLWEGIIAQKVNEPDDYRVSGKTRQNVSKLVEENDGNEKVKSFCDEFIFYDCRQQKDVKEDVPGRHSISHSWYAKYPSKKMALNAILFTDFLLTLAPLPQLE